MHSPEPFSGPLILSPRKPNIPDCALWRYRQRRVDSLSLLHKLTALAIKDIIFDKSLRPGPFKPVATFHTMGIPVKESMDTPERIDHAFCFEGRCYSAMEEYFMDTDGPDGFITKHALLERELEYVHQHLRWSISFTGNQPFGSVFYDIRYLLLLVQAIRLVEPEYTATTLLTRLHTFQEPTSDLDRQIIWVAFGNKEAEDTDLYQAYMKLVEEECKIMDYA
jgi:hypothetical protein